MADCDEFDEVLRLCRTDESDDESCNELSGEAENTAPFTVRFVSERALIDLAGMGDRYGDVARVSPPNSCPGESCGIAELKNSRPLSAIVPAISESKMRGESNPGSDDGKGSSVEAMAIPRGIFVSCQPLSRGRRLKGAVSLSPFPEVEGAGIVGSCGAVEALARHGQRMEGLS